ncbi:MAG TPA: alkaline phosphatase family protein [Patescibacteria group bacterium]|nr:alkaline phosphatase family protein [Patescibacteria group bacterium]
MKKSPRKLISTKKLVILGIDGMDPNILDKGFREGLFPNLKQIANNGFYSTLSTTTPPQSPVAWASFATGQDPSVHGIFDFIRRDPVDYGLNLSFFLDSVKKRTSKVDPFWIDFSKEKIRTVSLFLPDLFGLPKKMCGKMILGMGVPDILGTQGRYTFFTTKIYSKSNLLRRGIVVNINKSKIIKTYIEGEEYQDRGKKKTVRIPIEFKILGDIVEIKIQKSLIKLKVGEFSEWVNLEFRIDFLNVKRGIAKFYIKSVAPDLEVYLSPINLDPISPSMAISYPENFSKELSLKLGNFSTLGFPHDTWALEEGVLDEKAFLIQANSIILEREKIYYSELESQKEGLLFAYFGMLDTISHMFWRFRNSNRSYRSTINEYYERVDKIVGQTLSRLDNNTGFVILSDHGFGSFDFEFNINSWLENQGYLTLKNKSGGILYENVDWSKTKVYAGGYNSVFFNIRGREVNGVLGKNEAISLQKEIITKLANYKNPKTNKRIIKHIYTREEMGVDDGDLYAPDLIVGFYKNTRSSWDSAVGAVTNYVLRERKSKWNGDHLFDPSEVPGVIFVNKNISFVSPSIKDIIRLSKKYFLS